MITVLKYAAILLTAVSGILAILKDHKKANSKKLTKTGILLMAIIIISLAVSIWLDVLSDKETTKKENDFKSDITLLKQKNDSLRNNLNQTRDTLKDKIDQLEKDNFALSRELTKSSLELNKNILGEGYGIFEVYGSSQQGEYYSGVRSENKYPLYDISLLVTDFNEAIKCKTSKEANKFTFDQDCYFKNSTNVKSNTLSPSVVSFVDYTFKSSSDTKNLEIIFTSRSAHILQQAVFKLQKGICPQSYRIFKIEDKKLTLLKVHNDLKLPDTYWKNNFYPIQNRTLGIYQNQ